MGDKVGVLGMPRVQFVGQAVVVRGRSTIDIEKAGDHLGFVNFIGCLLSDHRAYNVHLRASC